MVETGLFDDLDVVFAQHIMTTKPIGEIHIKPGAVTANSDTFELTINGQGGHASQTENSIDSLIIGSRIVTQVKDIVSRMEGPLENLVISINILQSSNCAINVILLHAELLGSVRSV